MKFLLLVMFNLISLFRGLSVSTNDFKWGKGNFWKVIGPLGFFIGTGFGKDDYYKGILGYIIGIIFNIIILVTLLMI